MTEHPSRGLSCHRVWVAGVAPLPKDIELGFEGDGVVLDQAALLDCVVKTAAEERLGIDQEGKKESSASLSMIATNTSRDQTRAVDDEERAWLPAVSIRRAWL